MKIERKHGAKRREKVTKKALCEVRTRAGPVIGKVEGQSDKTTGLWAKEKGGVVDMGVKGAKNMDAEAHAHTHTHTA